MTIYPPLVPTKNELEYKTNPPLKISSTGTKNTKKSTQMPDGSALLTTIGNSNLKSQGIDHIIHAVPRKRSESANEEEFIEIAVKAAQNSIILAEREGIKKLAICFIAGLIYRGSCPADKLAEAIVIGSLNQLKVTPSLDEIVFVAYKDDKKNIYEPYLVDAFNKIKSELISSHFAPIVKSKVVSGDICDKNLHNAEAIVNSENAKMSWGAGISAAIKGALGKAEARNVDQQRRDLMKEFNSWIETETDETKEGTDKSPNNDKSLSVVLVIIFFLVLSTFIFLLNKERKED